MNRLCILPLKSSQPAPPTLPSHCILIIIITTIARTVQRSLTPTTRILSIQLLPLLISFWTLFLMVVWVKFPDRRLRLGPLPLHLPLLKLRPKVGLLLRRTLPVLVRRRFLVPVLPLVPFLLLRAFRPLFLLPQLQSRCPRYNEMPLLVL